MQAEQPVSGQHSRVAAQTRRGQLIARLLSTVRYCAERTVSLVPGETDPSQRACLCLRTCGKGWWTRAKPPSGLPLLLALHKRFAMLLYHWFAAAACFAQALCLANVLLVIILLLCNNLFSQVQPGALRDAADLSVAEAVHGTLTISGSIQ